MGAATLFKKTFDENSEQLLDDGNNTLF